MFSVILGIFIIVIAVVLLIGTHFYIKRLNANSSAAEDDARAKLAEAQDKQARFSAYRSETDREKLKELDPDDEFRYSSPHTYQSAVESAQRLVDSFDGNTPKTLLTNVISFGAIIVGLLLIIVPCFYTQDVGEAKVQVSWSGELVGQSTTPGLHLKAPWVGLRTFDVRNNLVTYVGTSEDGKPLPEYDGNVTTGPQITFQDKEGVTGNMDITLRYSIEPGSVLDVYSQFGTQENFVNKVISQGVRTDARTAPSSRTTLQVYSDRAGLASDIRAGLEKRWAGLGIIIEDVAIQEIRYSKDVTARFDEAQSARIAVTKAQAEQDAAKVTAQTKVIEAQGIADAAVVAAQGQSDANDLLTKSLTPQVLQQRYIDALKAGTIYVVPEGSTPLITTK